MVVKLSDTSLIIFQNLISRNYRGDIDFGIIDKFLPLVLEREEEEATSPIIVHGDVTFVYIKNNNLYRIFSVLCIYIWKDAPRHIIKFCPKNLLFYLIYTSLCLRNP